jgi:hypothetical protein
MQKLSSFAGGVRHGWDLNFNRNQQHHPVQQLQRQQQQPPSSLPPGTPISWCFKIPLKNNTLDGPDITKAIYSSVGAEERWTHPENSPDDTPIHSLPVHMQHLDNLQTMCNSLKERSGVEASLAVGRATTLAPIAGLQATPTNNVVANVCLHGPSYEIVRRVREAVLNGTPITLVRHLMN